MFNGPTVIDSKSNVPPDVDLRAVQDTAERQQVVAELAGGACNIVEAAGILGAGRLTRYDLMRRLSIKYGLVPLATTETATPMQAKSTRFLQAALAVACVTCSLLMSACGVADTPQALIAAGKEDLAKNDHAAAVIRFKSALQKDAQATEARYLLGTTLLKVSDPAGAALELSKALDQSYPAEQVLPPLANALLLTGEYKKLTLLYGDLSLQDKTAQAALKSSVAAAWGAMGDKVKTEAAIRDALAIAPEFAPAQILNARILAGQRETDRALVLIEKILKDDPSLHEAWHLKGEILASFEKDAAGSEAAFRKALALEPAYIPSHSLLIASRIAARDIPGAKAQAEELRAVLPKHPQTMLVDAQIAFSEQNLVKARELSQQLLRIAPNHVGVLQLAGAIEGQSGSLMLAEAHFNKALGINPDLPMARRNLALAALRLGQASRALEVLQPMLNAESGFAEAHAAAGEAYLQLGDARAAEEQFNIAARIDPSNDRIQAAIALSQLGRGDIEGAFSQLERLAANSKDTFADQALVSARIKRREYDLALKALDAMSRKGLDKASLAELRGRVHLLRQDFPAARLAFDEALKIDPRLFAATAKLASIDLAEKKTEQAQKRLEAAAAADPRNHYARMALAEMRFRAAAPLDEVTRTLKEAVQNSPNEAGPRLQLIGVLLKKRQYKEALTAAQEAAAAMPNDVAVLDAVGQAQMEAGDVEQAISTFRRIASMNEKSALPYVRLADIYKIGGKGAPAENALRKALELEPGLVPAQEALVAQLLATKRPQEAFDLARSLQRKRPTDASGYELEALVHLKLKTPEAAVAVLRKGMLMPGSNPGLGRSLYLALLKVQRGSEAESFAADWLKKHPEDVAFEYQTAVTAITRGDLEQAETRLRRVVAQRPTHPLALNNLAWTLASRNKPGGVAFAQRAVDQAPNNAALMDTLAMALAVDKQYDKALEVQRRAVEGAPADHTMRLNLARIALQAGDKALARKELDTLRGLGSAFPGQAEVAKLQVSL